MQKILVSRCLLGHRVRYDGGAHGPFALLQHWQAEGRVVALCPEVAGEGVTAAALRRAGVQVFSEEELPAAEAALRELETEAGR